MFGDWNVGKNDSGVLVQGGEVTAVPSSSEELVAWFPEEVRWDAHFASEGDAVVEKFIETGGAGRIGRI